MNLTVLTPLGVVLQADILKLTLETIDGYRTLLPKHIDFVSALCPNIMTYWIEEKNAKYVACHNGIVVKKGKDVTISVQSAVLGDNLDELEETMQKEYKQNEEQRKELGAAMARLELGIVRGFDRLRGDKS